MVSLEHLKQAFEKLELTEEEYEFIYPVLVKGAVTVAGFCELLKKDLAQAGESKFQRMQKKDLDQLTKILADINKSRKANKKSNYKKLIRLDDLKEESGSAEWESIF